MDRLFGIEPRKPRRQLEQSTSLSQGNQREIYRFLTNTYPSRGTSSSHRSEERKQTTITEEAVELSVLPRDESFNEPGPGKPFEYRGCEPPMLMVARRVDVDRQKWEFFCKKSLGRSPSGIFTNFFQAGEPDDLNKLPPTEAPSHRSIFQLPVFSPYSRFYQIWASTLTMVDVTYTAFLVPIIVAFVGRSGTIITHTTPIIELFFGCIFLADIIMNLHVGFMLHYEYKRKVVMEGKFILWYYVKHGGAWIDLLSITPLFYEIYALISDGFGSHNDQVTILRLFRLLRLYRLLKVLQLVLCFFADLAVQKMYGSSFSGSHGKLIFNIEAPSGVIYLFSVVYTMLVMMNLLGCALFYIAYLEDERLDGTWVHKYILATEDVDSPEAALDYIGNQTSPELYLTSLYWAVTTVTTVGYGDITPNSYLEMVVLIVVMLSHIMLFGLLVGSISELVKSSLRSMQFQEETKKKVETIAKWMKFRHLNDSIIKKINAYYTESWKASKDFEEEEILRDLPLSLRTSVIYKLTKDLMSRLSVFSGIEESTLKKLAGRLVPISLPPGQELIRQGDPVDALYILEEGTMCVLFNEAELYSIDGPETCAEVGILAHFIPQLNHHPITLRSATACSLWKLSSKDAAVVFSLDSKLKTALTEGYRLRLIKSLDSGYCGTSIQKQIEAEFGYEVSDALSRQFRNELERVNGSDGTFGRLIEDFLSGRFKKQSASRLERFHSFKNCDKKQQVLQRAIAENPLYENHQKGILSLKTLIQQHGPFGMVDWVIALQKEVKETERLDLRGFQRVSEAMKTSMKPQLLLSLFVEFDISESGFINIYTLIGALRESGHFSEREQMVEDIFHHLCNQQKQEADGELYELLSFKTLVQSYNLDNHPEVQSNSKTKQFVLNQLIVSFPPGDIRSQDFLDFHKDVSLCVEEDEEFFHLVSLLWSAGL